MTKPTDDHQTQNTPAGEFEPFETFDLEHCPDTGPNPHKPEPAQAADPMAQAFFTLSQAGKIFGKSRARCACGRIRAAFARSKLAAPVTSPRPKFSAFRTAGRAKSMARNSRDISALPH